MTSVWQRLTHPKARDIIEGYVQRDHGRLRIVVREQPDLAVYDSAEDSILVAPMLLGCDDMAFYHGLLHELAHSTGARHRLNRPWIHRVVLSDREVDFEEIIAELTALHLMRIARLLGRGDGQGRASRIRTRAGSWEPIGVAAADIIQRATPFADDAKRFILIGL